MKTKVWLSIDPQVLADAQQLAKRKKQSFSKLIEDQLRILTSPAQRKGESAPKWTKVKPAIKLQGDPDKKEEAEVQENAEQEEEEN